MVSPMSLFPEIGENLNSRSRNYALCIPYGVGNIGDAGYMTIADFATVAVSRSFQRSVRSKKPLNFRFYKADNGPYTPLKKSGLDRFSL